MKIKTKIALMPTSNRRNLRFDYVLSKKLKNSRPGSLVEGSSSPSGPTSLSRQLTAESEQEKQLNALTYSTAQRTVKLVSLVIKSYNWSQTESLVSNKVLRKLIHEIDLAKLSSSIDHEPRTSSYKWVQLFRIKQTLCLRENLLTRLLSKPSGKELQRSYTLKPQYKTLNAFDPDLETMYSDNEVQLSPWHLVFGTRLLSYDDTHQLFLRNVRNSKRLVEQSKQRVRSALLQIISSRLNVNNAVTSTHSFEFLVDILHKVISFTQLTNRLDQTLYLINKDHGQWQTNILPPSKRTVSHIGTSEEALSLFENHMDNVPLSQSKNLSDAHIVQFIGAPTWANFYTEVPESPEETSDQRPLPSRVKPILNEILECKAVSRTRAGGRTRRFKVIIVIGRKEGWVGIGVGKHKYIPEALQKARLDAAQNIMRVRRTTVGSIPHAVTGKFKKAHVLLKPLAVGSGMMIGAAIKTVLILAGYRNVWGLQMGSSNRLCNVRAALNALSQLRSETELISLRKPTQEGVKPHVPLFSALKAYVTVKL